MSIKCGCGAIALGLGLASLPVSAEVAEYRLDPEHSSVLFFVSHMGFADVAGRFGGLQGRLLFDSEAPAQSSVEVTVDAASVTTFHERRDQHLKSPDFFNVVEFPHLTFESTSVAMAGPDRGTLNGNLTLLGVTRPVALELKLNRQGLHTFNKRDWIAGFKATGTLRRSDFGMNYGLVDDIGIGDEVELRIEVEATRITP
ncbi:YceI family protein [Motiliproteus sediminis]|uniref:YceI family protein n=1 Tax=Motiliproteus sediminis TaxID=1468178 RepID=UPI001AF00066|nr:YceI family protein [Motiliproteus sediminis]